MHLDMASSKFRDSGREPLQRGGTRGVPRPCSAGRRDISIQTTTPGLGVSTSTRRKRLHFSTGLVRVTRPRIDAPTVRWFDPDSECNCSCRAAICRPGAVFRPAKAVSSLIALDPCSVSGLRPRSTSSHPAAQRGPRGDCLRGDPVDGATDTDRADITSPPCC